MTNCVVTPEHFSVYLRCVLCAKHASVCHYACHEHAIQFCLILFKALINIFTCDAREAAISLILMRLKLSTYCFIVF